MIRLLFAFERNVDLSAAPPYEMPLKAGIYCASASGLRSQCLNFVPDEGHGARLCS